MERQTDHQTDKIHTPGLPDIQPLHHQQDSEELQPTVCIICGETKAEGITICSEFICDECEAEIVKTDVQDEKYPVFIHKMRVLWLQKDA